MKLYYSKASPYVRKVLLTAHLKNLIQNIEIIDFGQTGTFVPSADFKTKNPLSKVPALETSQGEVVINSPVICEYLDSLSDTPSIYPCKTNLPFYFFHKKAEAIADGIMDAAVLRRMESQRPEAQKSAEFDQKQKEKMQQGLDWFEAHLHQLSCEKFLIAEISLISCLGYLELRFKAENWLDLRPQLKKWHESVQNLAFVKATSPLK